MLKLCRVTKVKVLFLMLIYIFNFNLFEFSAAILKKGLFSAYVQHAMYTEYSLDFLGKQNSDRNQGWPFKYQ